MEIAGLEPTIFCVQYKRFTKLSHIPSFIIEVFYLVPTANSSTVTLLQLF